MPILDARQHTFDTIAGQQLVKRFLLRALELGRLPKALLFTGPEGVGKRSLLFALAKILVSRHLEPGGEKYQRAIGKVERGTHPDVLVVEPRSASGQILKEQIEEMHDRAYYAPLESRHRVVILNPAESMNPTSANKLLKLLEEPPPNLHLILGSRHVHRVLPTIFSRCALLRCPPIELDALAAWLMANTGCPKRKAETAARLSGGRPGLAAELLTGEDERRRRNLTRDLDMFHREGYPAIFRVARNVLDGFDGTESSVTALLVWLRDLLIASLTAGAGAENATPPAEPPEVTRDTVESNRLIINSDLATEIAAAAARHNPRKIAAALGVVLERQERPIGNFVDGDLLMQVLLTRVGMALK